MALRDVLGIPKVYSAFARFVGGDARGAYVRDYVRPAPGAKVLDIGCGTADILTWLPAGIEYTGFDSSAPYIAEAQARFGSRGHFFQAEVTPERAREFSGFDIVLANGVLHHLDDADARHLLDIARIALRPGGRLVTLDGAYAAGQSPIARMLLARDRGRFVRPADAYRTLALQAFGNVKIDVRHDLLRMPYTLAIMECSDPPVMKSDPTPGFTR